MRRSDHVRKRKEADLDDLLIKYERDLDFIDTENFTYPRLHLSSDLAKSALVTAIFNHPYSKIPHTLAILGGCTTTLKLSFDELSLKVYLTLKTLYPDLNISAFSSQEHILFNLHIAIQAHNYTKKNASKKKSQLLAHYMARKFCCNVSLSKDLIDLIVAYVHYPYNCCDLERVLPYFKIYVGIPD
ncbi:MAG: hypothetical protein WBQ73_00075 [Candidatus Babeliales bacterium]